MQITVILFIKDKKQSQDDFDFYQIESNTILFLFPFYKTISNQLKLYNQY